MPIEPSNPVDPPDALAASTDESRPNDEINITPEPMASASESAGVSTTKRKPNRILRTLRNTVRVLVAVIFLIAIAGALVSFTPLSFRWSDRLIQAQLEQATGLQIEFSRAEFTLSRGQLKMDAPKILDPADGATLATLESIECYVDASALLRSVVGRSGTIDVNVEHIGILGPLELRLEERDGHVELSDGLSRILEIANAHQEKQSEDLTSSDPSSKAKMSVNLTIGSLDLDEIQLELTHLTDEGDQALARISRADLRLDFEPNSLRPAHLLCHGTIEGVEGESDFKLDLKPNSERDEMALDLTLQPFDTNKNLLTAPQFHLRTSTIIMRGMLRRKEGGDWAINADMDIPRITLADVGEARKDYDFEAAKLYTELKWIAESRHIALDSAELTSRDGDLTAQGRVELFAPYRYAVNVDALRLRDRALELIEQLMVKEEFLARPIGGSVELTGTVNGRFEQINPDEINLNFTLGEIAMTLSEFPEPITQVQLQGSFRNHEFLLTRGQARVQNIPVEFTGGIRGKLIEGQMDHAEIFWKTAGELKDISEIVRRSTKGPASDFSYKGDIEGSGEIRFDNPEMGDWKTMVERADIKGSLTFNNAELSHAELKEPIRDLKGHFSYDKASARLQNITGRIDSVPFMIDGAISGSDHFWDDPQATVTLETTLSLADREKYFGWLELDQSKDWPALTGKADITTFVTGPINDWRKLDFKGSAMIESLSVPLDTRLTSGTLEAPRVEIAFAPKEIRLVRAEGRWQGIDITAKGTLGLDEGRFDLTADGPIAGFKAALAKPLSRFIVDGRASATHVLVLKRKDADTIKVESFSDLIPPSEANDSPRSDESNSVGKQMAEQWDAEGDGQILLTDAEFTYDLMPTRLMNANGKFLFNHQKIWNDGKIPLRVGEKSAGTMADLEVTYATENTPTTLKGKITGGHLDVDQWVSGWKKIDRKGPPPPPEEKITLLIDVAVETNSVSYRGLQGTDLSGSFHLTDFSGKRHILEVKNAYAKQGDGHAHVDVRWEHFATNDIEEYDIAVEKFDVASIMRSFTSLKSQGGIASGLISGNLKMSQIGKGKNPFNGSGRFTVQDSRFVSNAILGGLGKILSIEEIFNDISFPRIEGAFVLRDSVIVVEGENQVLFENPALLHPLDLKLQGSLGPESKLNLNVNVRFLPRVGNIPVIGKVWDVVNGLTGNIFRYNVGGTIEEPQISVLPKLN